MSREDPPWQCPAAGCADGGGSISLWRIWQTIGNDGAQSQRLLGDVSPYARSAAHGKPVETLGQQSLRLKDAAAIPCPFGCRTLFASEFPQRKGEL